MVGVRVAFDVSLPFVAAQAFETGGESYVDGKPFPWRDLSITEDTLHAMWRSGLVRCEPGPIVAPTKPPQRSRAAK